MQHYLDYNATAPMRPEVMELMRELQGVPLNASSVHAAGRKARGIIEDARREIAEHIGAFPQELVFTASGTEANNWALRAFASGAILVCATEHSSVRKATPGAAVVPVTRQGIIDLDAFEKMLPSESPFLASLMLANNETGVIHPVREASLLVHARGGLLHCDAVQALGKIPVDFTQLGCDLMTLSAHKMGGPVGAAALIIRNKLEIAPLLSGGGQEMNRRAGTENVPAIAGFAKAAALMDFAPMESLRSWLQGLEEEILDCSGGSAVVFGAGAARLPNTACIAIPGLLSEMQLIRFDLAGIAASAGSACSSGRTEPSHVLTAMGAGKEEVGSSLRISGGWNSRKADIEAAGALWKTMIKTESCLNSKISKI